MHLLYSPDLTPCDFWLFPTHKRRLQGQSFQLDADVVQEVKPMFGRTPLKEFAKMITKNGTSVYD